jgi:hypothetical protein
MNHLRRILVAVITLAGAALALASAPAALAKPLPPPDCCTSSTANAPVTVMAGGGMPGWQITLIAIGAALVGAALALLLERAWVARKTHQPATGQDFESMSFTGLELVISSVSGKSSPLQPMHPKGSGPDAR